MVLVGGGIDNCKYSYLWDGSCSGWVLLHINSDKPEEAPRYLIFNVETRRSLLIRDDKVCAEVKQAMLNGGVRIVTSINES
ncbi:hypothetical protein GD429_22960 [Burkholderia sp. BE17]|nr:hypothetical protein [Burkholderia sp. BE17]